MSRCKNCRAPIMWGTVLEPGKPARRMPFNPIPTADGPYVLGARAPEYRRLQKGEQHEGWRYTPHNDTCGEGVR